MPCWASTCGVCCPRCRPSQGNRTRPAAWLCAMSSGSAARGALLMLAFALGTVPLMLLFASLGALLPRGWTKYLRKLGAVLVTSMGLKMLIGGLLLLRG